MNNIYKSHVLLSKFIMKRFAFNNEGKGLYVDKLCLNDLKITSAPIKTLDTIENYYTEEAEHFLAREIEMKMGETLNKIKNKYIKNNHVININKDDVYNIRLFFKYTLIRDKRFINEVIDGSEMLKEINDLNHSYFILNSGNIDFPFDESSIYVFINESNSNYICPHNLIYYVYFDNLDSYIACITFDKKIVIGINMNEKENKINYALFTNPVVVKNINYFAYIMEKDKKDEYIIGEKEDLECILKQDYKEEDFLKYGLNISSNL